MTTRRKGAHQVGKPMSAAEKMVLGRSKGIPSLKSLGKRFGKGKTTVPAASLEASRRLHTERQLPTERPRLYASRASRIDWFRTQMIRVAVECLESDDAASAWIGSAAFALGGRVPWKVCVSKKGLQECVKALRRIDYNIAS